MPLFKRTITLDEDQFKELCTDIEKELRKELEKEYRDLEKAVNFNAYKIKVEYSNLERKYIELVEAYDILQAKLEGLEKGNKKNTKRDRYSELASEIFGNDA
jgi:predicted nuclease with TOPRIM domain